MKKQANPWKVRVTWEESFRTKAEMICRLRDVMETHDGNGSLVDEVARYGRAQASDSLMLLTIEVVNAPIR